MCLGLLFVASEKLCLTLGNVEQNYQIFAKIYSQIYLCKYFNALPLSHASLCFLSRCERIFFTGDARGAGA